MAAPPIALDPDPAIAGWNSIWDLLVAADDLGIRLEIVNGLTVWEAHPAYRHQKVVYQIQQSIQAGRSMNGECQCAHASDVYIRFRDGSHKRPDIAIFCREPDEQEEAITLLPEAVVEIISKGFEKKDTEIGVPFYLSQGVKDVIVLNPTTSQLTHHRRDGVSSYSSPTTLVLECGCTCTV